MIHLVFNEADVAVLQKAQQLEESLAGNIVLIRDDYAVGPLAEHQDAAGYQQRRQWWRTIVDAALETAADETLGMVDDKMTVHQLLQQMEQKTEEVLWIWAAQNKHDVSGYYWLISQLQALQGRVFILYLNNLPFINEQGGIFYPQWLHQIPAKEFLKARKLARPVTASEFEIDTDEYRRLCAQGAGVRLLEGGKKLTMVAEDYFDAALTRHVTGDFSRAARVIQQFLNKEKETTGDWYLHWRLLLLAQANGWEIKGDTAKGIAGWEVRNAALPSSRRKQNAAEVQDEG